MCICWAGTCPFPSPPPPSPPPPPPGSANIIQMSLYLFHAFYRCGEVWQWLQLGAKQKTPLLDRAPGAQREGGNGDGDGRSREPRGGGGRRRGWRLCSGQRGLDFPTPEIHHYYYYYLIFKGSTVRAPVFGRHQFFGTPEHYGKPMEVYYLDEWIIITLYVAGLLHSAIF